MTHAGAPIAATTNREGDMRASPEPTIGSRGTQVHAAVAAAAEITPACHGTRGLGVDRYHPGAPLVPNRTRTQARATRPVFIRGM